MSNTINPSAEQKKAWKKMHNVSKEDYKAWKQLMFSMSDTERTQYAEDKKKSKEDYVEYLTTRVKAIASTVEGRNELEKFISTFEEIQAPPSLDILKNRSILSTKLNENVLMTWTTMSSWSDASGTTL